MKVAIVREFTARNGVRVKIADDCYAHLSAEENRRRYDEACRRILEIVAADILKNRPEYAAQLIAEHEEKMRNENSHGDNQGDAVQLDKADREDTGAGAHEAPAHAQG